MFNRHTAARNISLHWEQLGLHPPWRPCLIRDMDSHTVLATAQQYRITLITPAHGVRALRFTCGAAPSGPAPERPPPLPPPQAITPPPPPWVSDAPSHSLIRFCKSSLSLCVWLIWSQDTPPVLVFGLEVQLCNVGASVFNSRSFNSSTQGFVWRSEDSTLRLASNPTLCVTYLGESEANVGLAVCHGGGGTKPWAMTGIGAQIWALSNTTASSFVYSVCEPKGAADTSRCFNVVGCNASAHAFEVGDVCLPPQQGGCDQQWRLEAGQVQAAADGYRSCLTLGAPK